MTNKSRLILAALVATLATASPAFAQSFSAGYGTNVLPFNSRATITRDQHVPVRHQGIARERGGLGAFAMEPGELRSSDDPAETGGGSIGYNSNLYNY